MAGNKKSNSILKLALLSFGVQFLAYYLSAVFYTRDPAIIMKEPFAKLFNIYTPVFMFCFFIVFELVFFVVMMSENRDAFVGDTDKLLDSEKGVEMPSEAAKELDNSISSASPSMMTEQLQNEPVESVVHEPVTESKPQVETDVVTAISPTVGADVSEDIPKTEFKITPQMYDELYDIGFSNDQILQFKKFGSSFPDLTVKKIRKMFEPSMTAEEISERIEMFYA